MFNGSRGLANFNAPGLHGLGNNFLQADFQQTVGQPGASHLDIVSQVELALEGPVGNSLVEVLALLVPGLLASANRQHSALNLDIYLATVKSGHGQGDRVAILLQHFDVDHQ